MATRGLNIDVTFGGAITRPRELPSEHSTHGGAPCVMDGMLAADQVSALIAKTHWPYNLHVANWTQGRQRDTWLNRMMIRWVDHRGGILER